MKTIFKYQLASGVLYGQQSVYMPPSAEILKIGVQLSNSYPRQETITIWAYVDDAAMMENLELRNFFLLHTGDYVHEGWEYLETLILDSGNYILHIHGEVRDD